MQVYYKSDMVQDIRLFSLQFSIFYCVCVCACWESQFIFTLNFNETIWYKNLAMLQGRKIRKQRRPCWSWMFCFSVHIGLILCEHQQLSLTESQTAYSSSIFIFNLVKVIILRNTDTPTCSSLCFYSLGRKTCPEKFTMLWIKCFISKLADTISEQQDNLSFSVISIVSSQKKKQGNNLVDFHLDITRAFSDLMQCILNCSLRKNQEIVERLTAGRQTQ